MSLLVIVVCSGLTSLETTFQSDHGLYSEAVYIQNQFKKTSETHNRSLRSHDDKLLKILFSSTSYYANAFAGLKGHRN